MLLATFADRPDLAARTSEIPEVWPEFMLHDAVVRAYWSRLEVERPEFQLVLYDDERDVVVGEGRTAPFRWDGLPAGFDDMLTGAFEDDGAPTALSACVAVISPERRGEGLSKYLIKGMAGLAARHGLERFVAPVRPTMKSRYPLTTMARYVEWRTDEGLLFDPWLRVHARLGAEILEVCEPSMTIRGTVEEWESWTGMAFPETGPYIVEGALVPVSIDRENDLGEYVEPNVWMRHPVK
jgi:GNAT superfamily N-acetyltransferase